MEPAADTLLDGLKPQHQICAVVPMRLAHLPDSLVDLLAIEAHWIQVRSR
jgi:hypothetical protein